MDFIYLAQDLVESISSLVGGRTINFMNCSGTIIASTEKERIGTVHQGACEVIQKGKPIKITKEEVFLYPGAREGYNMPIFYEDTIFGVIGIYGNPEEVEALANLLKIYVTQFIKQDFFSRKTIFKKEVHAQIIRLLLQGKQEDESEIQHLCSTVGIKFCFPLKIYYFNRNIETTNKPEPNYEMSHSYQDLEEQLLWRNLISKANDVYGPFGRGFLWFHFLKEYERSKPSKVELFSRESRDYLVIESEICYRFEQISPCFKAIEALIERSREIKQESETYYNLETPYFQQEYYLHKMTHKYGKDYIQKMYERFVAKVGAKMTEILLTTGLIYFEEESSVNKASERLHIHKNTLIYRLKRLYLYLDLEEESHFTKELFVRLLVTLEPPSIRIEELGEREEER